MLSNWRHSRGSDSGELTGYENLEISDEHVLLLNTPPPEEGPPPPEEPWFPELPWLLQFECMVSSTSLVGLVDVVVGGGGHSCEIL